MTDLIEASSGQIKTMADGTLRLFVDIEPRHAQAAFSLFGAPGVPMVLARLTQAAAQASAQSQAGEYGQYAAALHKSGFFLNPHVLGALGSDDEFLEFVRTRQCCAPRGTACDGGVVAAHVRRVANGAGTGIKPAYSAVPLCHKHHGIQHISGESAIGGKEYLDKQRAEMCNAWGHAKLREWLEVESLADVEPGKIVQWAELHGLSRFLPAAFKGLE